MSKKPHYCVSTSEESRHSTSAGPTVDGAAAVRTERSFLLLAAPGGAEGGSRGLSRATQPAVFSDPRNDSVWWGLNRILSAGDTQLGVRRKRKWSQLLSLKQPTGKREGSAGKAGPGAPPRAPRSRGGALRGEGRAVRRRLSHCPCEREASCSLLGPVWEAHGFG